MTNGLVARGPLRRRDAAAPPTSRRESVGAVIKDPVQDRVVWLEYLETVVKERKGWSDLYRASRELTE